MDEDFGLAELGVTSRSAALVEEQVLQEALVDAGDASGEGIALGEDNARENDHGPIDRERVASKLSTVQQEISTMEAAMEAAQAEAEQDGPDGSPAGDALSAGEPKTALHATSPLQLQLAVMRDRLVGLRAERDRLAQRLTEAQPDAAAGRSAGVAAAPGTSPQQQRHQRMRFGARALSRAGAASGGSSTAGAGGLSASAASHPQDLEQKKHIGSAAERAVGEAGAKAEGGSQRPAKRVRIAGAGATAAAAAGSRDLLDGDEAAEGGVAAAGPGGSGGGGARLELVETEKDRLIRKGLLTPFDCLAGFERKIKNAPAAATAPAAVAGGAVTGTGGSGARAAAGAAAADAAGFQKTGQGSLRHLGRAELRPDEASALTRSGRTVGEVVAEAGRVALQARESRHKAKFLEPEQLPQQERDVRRIPQHFWHQAASARKAGASRRLRRAPTLPRAKPSKARRKRSVEGGEKEDGVEDEETQEGARRRRRRRLRRATDGAVGPAVPGTDAPGDAAVSSEGQEVRGSDSDWACSDSDNHSDGSDGGDRGSSAPSDASSDELGDAGANANGDRMDDFDDSMFDDADEEFYQERLRRSLEAQKGDRRRRRSQGDPQSGRGTPSGRGKRPRQRLRSPNGGSSQAAGAVGGGAYGSVEDEEPPRTVSEPGDEEPPEGELEGEEPEEEVVFEGGFRLPSCVYGRLFDYQQTAVKWLWELHTQQAGGILGDEMGLGKTVQIIAYLAGLQHSGLYRPSLIVCPATVVRQWLRELRTWWPQFRVVVLHESGKNPPTGSVRPGRPGLLDIVLSSPAGLVLTTYDQLRINRDLLLRVRWGVAVLDEGHKIRNPDSEITLVCKQLPTVHRLIMSGSPIQNRLAELWSLFDFIFPGKLGTLPVFQAQFAVPIQVGGYANASSLQVTTAYKCAVVLRDLIAPYLLRRRKADVATQLPTKTEQVLFCTLVPEQLELYRAYLASKEVGEILDGSRRALSGIDILRKICNHPDLLERLSGQDAEDYGNPSRSGKLRVAERVLSSWRAAGHKALLFCQTQQMLDIVEKLARGAGWRYHRMDGSTPVGTRARLIDDFNTNPTVFVFLLTTKVGGLGVNLTGATRVMLYDPDWNPSTDIQARERAWRIGQSQPVTIYRLITAGTIEEKVYHRQIYKNFLTNKVLRDPRQKRFFTARDIAELFTLGPEYKKGAPGAAAAASTGGAGDTETARIFGTALEMHDVLRGRSPSAEARGSGDTAWPGLSSTAAAAEALRRRGEREGADGDGCAAAAADGAPEAEGVAGAAASRQRRPDARGAGGRAAPGGLSGRGPAGRSQARAPGAAARAHGDGGDGGGGDMEDQDGGDGEDESRVLRDLFDGGAGIRGLLDHSKIEGANDPELIAQHAEAQRIAQRAAEALRRSRQACTSSSISTPTWTGRHGHAGAPAARPAGGGGGGAAGGSGTGVAQGAAPRRFGNVTNTRLRPGGSGVAAAVRGSHNSGGGGNGGGGVAAVPAAGPFSGAVAGARRAGPGGAAPSSAALLASLRSRQQAVRGAAAETSRAGRRTAVQQPASAPPAPAPRAGTQPTEPSGEAPEAAAGSYADALASELVAFLDERGGMAGSEELVEAFRNRVAPAQMPLFKQLLKQVAGLKRRAGGGQWVLRAEYRTGAGLAEAGRAAPLAGATVEAWEGAAGCAETQAGLQPEQGGASAGPSCRAVSARGVRADTVASAPEHEQEGASQGAAAGGAAQTNGGTSVIDGSDWVNDCEEEDGVEVIDLT